MKEQPLVSAAAFSSAVLNETNVNSLLLAALKQFKDQATVHFFSVASQLASA